MSRRVLARPFAAATLAVALVLTPALATADPGNGKGGGQDNGTGQEQAPGQQKGKSKDDKSEESKDDKDNGDQSQGGDAETAPGRQKDKSKDDKSQGDQGKGGGNETAPGQQKDKGGDKGQGGKGDPAGNNGTVKIAPYGEMDSIPNNTPHPGCTFQVEWYGFDEGDDVVSTVTFEAWSPTRDVVIGGTSPSQVFVGGDPATGAGTDTGLDGTQAYTLTFDGEPHPKQGYHVKLTVSTPRSQGNDTKSKVFWVAPCDEETTTGGVEGTTDTDDECTEEMTEGATEGTECESDEECTGDMTEGSTEGTEDECVAGTEDESGSEDSADQGVLGTQLAAATAPVQQFAGLLTSRNGSGDTAAVPTSVDAGADGGLSALTDSPWPLVALLAGLLAGLGALVLRRRAGA